MKAWRMKKMCVDCPFASSGPGAHLRRTLRPGRMEEIKQGLRDGNYFPCHQGLGDGLDDDGEEINVANLVCAGALSWQEGNGYSSVYVRLCRALEARELERRRRRRKKRAVL